MAHSTANLQPDMASFDLDGTHYDIGVRIGRASSPLVMPSWWPEPPPLDFALACAQTIGAAHAPLLEELYGYADGQAIEYETLLRVICRQRLGGPMRMPMVIPEQGGCTSVAWRTPEGRVMVGRNYDFHNVQRVRQRIRLHPDGARPSVGMRGSVPGGRYDGVNDAGLFVSLHVVLSDRVEAPRPGLPFHLIPRILLETCATREEALREIMIMPHLHSFNYLIADLEGFCCVECHHERVRIVYPEDDVLAVGNFYRHPDMATLQKRRQQTVSRARVAYLESKAWQRKAENAWDALQRALRDHEVGVCGHSGGHTTLWSCIADLSSKRIAYTSGAPCKDDYAPIPWPA
ncbi:MAG TPA: C45 family peptidase [Aggregatilineales bacterium]|nr:C45 family peptidase [Aggregatilineales bacterium]